MIWDDVKVGDIWYRYEGRSYSVSDEWGEHSHSNHKLEYYTYVVAKLTPKGCWLICPWNARADIDELQAGKYKHFVKFEARKKIAHPTREMALHAFLERKNKYVSIMMNRIAAQQRFIKMAQERLSDIIEENNHEQTILHS